MSTIAATHVTASDIDMSIPKASPIESIATESIATHETITLAQIQEYLPHLSMDELLEVMDKVNTLLKKGLKSGKGKVKIDADKPKKPASEALKRNQAWIPYVQDYVTKNGWTAFTIRQEIKDKATGETVVELTERSGSIPNIAHDDKPVYTYKDAKTGELIQPDYIFEDTGKHLIYKEAMSLSAILKWSDGIKPTKKEDEEAHWSPLYQQFLTEYSELHEQDDQPSTSSTPTSSNANSKVRHLTAAEREEEKNHKRQIAEEEKAEKRRAKEEEKETKRLQKEEEKEAKRLQKEEEKAKKAREKEEAKAVKEAEKEAKKSPVSVPKKVIAAPKPTTTSAPTPVAAKPAPTSVAAKPAPTSTSTTPPAATKSAPLPKEAKPAPVTKSAPTPALPSSSAIPSASTPAPSATTVASAPATVASTGAVSKTASKTVISKSNSTPKEEKMVWNIPDDNYSYPWSFQGQNYIVNSQFYAWKATEDGMAGDWVGMVILEENRIDDSVPEPEYED